MNDRGDIPIFLLLVVIITGAMGGCSIGALKLLHGRRITMLAFAAYGIIGMGLAAVSLLGMFTFTSYNNSELMFYSMLTSTVGTSLLVTANFGAKFVLRRLGWEVEVSLNRVRDRRRSVDEDGQ